MASHEDIPSAKTTYGWANNRGNDCCEFLASLADNSCNFSSVLINDGSCRTCGVSDSLEHILFYCSKYWSQRRQYWDIILNSECFRFFIHDFTVVGSVCLRAK